MFGISFLLLLVSYAFSQTMYNPNLTKYIIKERLYLFPDKKIDRDEHAFNLSYNNYLYFNTNQSNMENFNGLYLSKGYGSISGLLIQYKGEHFTISTEPRIAYFREYGTSLQGKNNLFSVLNDTPLDKDYRIHIYGNNYKTPDKTPVRDYIHVSDLAEIHLKVLKKIDMNREYPNPNDIYIK